VKVNCDAALDISRSRFGLGVVVRDHEGKVRAAQSLLRREAMASFHAVKLCKVLGFRNVWLEGDAKLVCDALNSRTSNLSSFGLLIEDIKVKLLSLSCWQCSHIGREANSAAHSLARDALRHVFDRSWEEWIPACIESIACVHRSR
jgi:ribonuclease HI